MADVVVGRKYNPYTGKWSDVYGPAPDSGGAKKTTPKTEPEKNKKSMPPKPTTPDKGNAHKGSGEDNKKKAETKTREIEYDLEGSTQIHPDPRFSNDVEARDIITYEGLGNNFSGDYFLATVVHTINRGGYQLGFDVLRNNFVWKASKTEAPKEKEPDKPKPVAPKKEPAKAPSRNYTVKKGDTLWAIAKRFYGNGADYMKIVNANKGKIKDPHWIFPSQSFLIP